MPSNKPQPSLRDQIDSIIDRELNDEDGLDSVSELMQLFESTMLEALDRLEQSIKKHNIPECQHYDSTSVIESIEFERTRLSALLGKGGK